MADMKELNAVEWPNGARCAVMLTFDFDAETLWLSRDPDNARRPGILSQGTYGSKVGVPRILEVLRDENIKSTFFVPGWTAENHTDRLEAIVADGHEIGHHGYLHEWIDPAFPDKEREALEKGFEALKKAVGVRPTGYRSPAGETSENLIKMLSEYGFTYDSSLMDEINPYRLALAGGGKGPVELPWHWSLDDAPYALFSIKNPRPIMPNDHILNVWKQEFMEIYKWGGLVNIIMHPQISGRPSRIAMLREFIAFVRRYPNVWFATGQDVASAWAKTEK
jgi:peptidoglycan/xylan/chitin deacetylase (PgdA/CDA1 family)